MKPKLLIKSTACLAMLATVFYGTAISAAPAAPVVTQHAAEVLKTPVAATAFDPVAPAQPEAGKVVNYTLVAERATLEIAPGETREVWTFNGQVPAPVLRVHQGDTVHITLINKDPEMEHGLDFHAGQMDMGTFHKPIKPGESESFDFVANYPGIFYYHCSAQPVIMHIANGMFGAVIVDPPGYTPTGKEYVLIQNEWYKDGADLEELENGKPIAVAFNGVPSQYATKPLTANPGEKVRLYFVNAGINNFSAFHVIGTIFDKVLLDGNPDNTLYGVQTVAVPPGGAVTAELYADTGTYAILSHSMKDAFKGALGILQVGHPGSTEQATSQGGDMQMPMPSPSQTPAPSASPAPTATPSPSAATAPAGSSGASTSAVTVHLTNFAYSPQVLNIKTGTKVTWMNDDATLHTIVSDNLFDSRTEKKDGINKGEQFSYTFMAPGTYKVHCTLHPFMTSTVNVN